MPEKSPLKRKYKGVVDKIRDNAAQYAAWTMVTLTPPSGGRTRNPQKATTGLRARIKADIPQGNRLAEAVYANNKAVRIKNNGWYPRNIFTAMKGRSGREARRRIVPAEQIFNQLSYFSYRKDKNGNRDTTRPAHRYFRHSPEPVWTRAADWNAVRRAKIAEAGGLLAAWAPVVAALKVPLRLPAAKRARGAAAQIRYDPGKRSFTLNFRSSLELNGVPRVNAARRELARNWDSLHKFS